MKEHAENSGGGSSRLRSERQASLRRRRRVASAPSRSRRSNGSAGPDLEAFVRRNAKGLTLLGLTLGVFVSRKFLILPVAVTATMLQDILADSLERLGGRGR